MWGRACEVEVQATLKTTINRCTWRFELPVPTIFIIAEHAARALVGPRLSLKRRLGRDVIGTGRMRPLPSPPDPLDRRLVFRSVAYEKSRACRFWEH